MNISKVLQEKVDAKLRQMQLDPAKGTVFSEDAAGNKTFTEPTNQTVLDLTDTPASYTGEAGKALIVKLAEDGIEFGEAGMALPEPLGEIDTATHKGIGVFTDWPTNDFGNMVALIGKKGSETSVYLEDSQADFEPGELEDVVATASGLELVGGTADGYGWNDPGAFTANGNFGGYHSVGWRFTAKDDIVIKGLRHIGNYAGNTHKLNLFDTTDSTIVGTCNVTTTNTGQWYEGEFAASVTLVKDRDYIVAANSGSPTTNQRYYYRTNPGGAEFNSNLVTYVGGRIGGTADVMPAVSNASAVTVDIIAGEDGSPHGNRIALPQDLTTLSTDPGLEIRWTTTTPAGTTVSLETAVKGETSYTDENIGTGDGVEDTFYLPAYPAERHSDVVISVDGTPTAEFTRANANDPSEIIFNSGHEPGNTLAVTATFTGVTAPSETAEVQTLYLGGATGGTFTLSDGTTTTSAIAYDASAADIETELETIYGAGLVTVAAATDFTITFSVRVRASGLTADFTSLTGATSPTLTETTAYSAGDWEEQTSGTAITNIPAGDLTGQHLWIRQTLETDDPAETPTLEELEVYYGSEEYGVFTTGGTVGTL